MKTNTIEDSNKNTIHNNSLNQLDNEIRTLIKSYLNSHSFEENTSKFNFFQKSLPGMKKNTKNRLLYKGLEAINILLNNPKTYHGNDIHFTERTTLSVPTERTRANQLKIRLNFSIG